MLACASNFTWAACVEPISSAAAVLFLIVAAVFVTEYAVKKVAHTVHELLDLFNGRFTPGSINAFGLAIALFLAVLLWISDKGESVLSKLLVSGTGSELSQSGHFLLYFVIVLAVLICACLSAWIAAQSDQD